MPRRPNTKNIPSRLFEDSPTPVFFVNSTLTIEYANAAVAALFAMEREQIVGQQLRYLADSQIRNSSDALNLICPPPGYFQTESTDSELLCFGVVLPGEKSYLIRCNKISNNDGSNCWLVCSMCQTKETENLISESSWIHQEIQRFRTSQSRKFQSIPFLGQSSEARKCFAQARAYALLESNTLLVGHPQSQIIELAKSIHYSGFSHEDEPNPLLPIDCGQLQGSRLQEILVGHFQVVCGSGDSTKAFVLLMNADLLDEVSQQDLLTISKLEEFQVRFISTAKVPLRLVPGFDNELADRLTTLELELPLLGSRVDDIPFLSQYILEKNEFADKTIGDELTRCLQLYNWKSDFRELEETIVFACENSDSPILNLNACSHDFKMAMKAMENPLPKIESVDLDELLAEIEVETIRRAIKASGGNKTNAARMLGITRARLHRKLGDLEQELSNGSTESDSQ